LEETKDAEKKFLLTIKMNSTAMCFLCDKVSQLAFYNGRTTDLPSGDATKVWKIYFFHSKNVKTMNELKGEFVRSTLNNAETNPDERFAGLFFIRCYLKEDNKCNSFGDVEMMNKIIYITQPAAYQMQLTGIE
jgi:hypothetical protein